MLEQGSFWIYQGFAVSPYRMLFFSGDTDGCVPTSGSRKWLELLDWEVLEEWKPWLTDGELSGYKMKYKGGGGLDFVTVHGVGHMAPQWKRKDVMQMVMKWVHEEW